MEALIAVVAIICGFLMFRAIVWQLDKAIILLEKTSTT